MTLALLRTPDTLTSLKVPQQVTVRSKTEPPPTQSTVFDMPKKPKKGAKEEASNPTDDDPTVTRIACAPPAPPTTTAVLPIKVAAPVPLLPLWDENSVNEQYQPKRPDDEEEEESNTTDTIDTNAPYVDHSTDLLHCLPAEMAKKPHDWKRPVDVLDLPYWNEQKTSNLPEFDLCVVDLHVPPTEEAQQERALALEQHEAAVKAAEEAGEEAPEAPVENVPPTPREILRPLVSNGSYSSRFASIFELINSVSLSYLRKKEADAPPPPTPEEQAAMDEAKVSNQAQCGFVVVG